MLGRNWQSAGGLAREPDNAIVEVSYNLLRPLDREEQHKQLERRHHKVVQGTAVTAEQQAWADAAQGTVRLTNARGGGTCRHMAISAGAQMSMSKPLAKFESRGDLTRHYSGSLSQLKKRNVVGIRARSSCKRHEPHAAQVSTHYTAA